MVVAFLLGSIRIARRVALGEVGTMMFTLLACAGVILDRGSRFALSSRAHVVDISKQL